MLKWLRAPRLTKSDATGIAGEFAMLSEDTKKGMDALGRGDFATAKQLLDPPATRGELHAQFLLGQLYFSGNGVPQDFEISFKWVQSAAQKGHLHACSRLGSMYENGAGVTQNYEAAAEWYLVAAENGDTLAQTCLGMLYLEGKGVIQNNVYAHMWANLAASKGDEEGIMLRDNLSEIMTSSQIEKAQEVAREYIRKKSEKC